MFPLGCVGMSKVAGLGGVGAGDLSARRPWGGGGAIGIGRGKGRIVDIGSK